MAIYAVTVFLSAFLLFLVQPLLARYILPWFGGSPGVWNTCLLFFQVILTAGYGSAHFLAGRFAPRTQAILALLFLGLTLATLPVTPSRTWIPENLSTPATSILLLLLASVGACYFLLSSTGPLLQSWFSRIWPDTSPYRLYTLSNLGSLLAILGYPFILEPNLPLGLQTRLWSAFYALFALCGCLCVRKLWNLHPALHARPAASAGPVKPSDRWLWLLLPALGSTLLLATTNQLCLDVAAVPLLWLLPMGLYLLSFILCFHSERWYSRSGYGIALGIALVQTCVVMHHGVFLALPVQIASYSLTLFVCCMVCHGELVRRKPDPGHLTSFYLMISAGGALGGIAVNIIAPHLFKGYWEYALALAGTGLLFLVILFRDPQSRLQGGRPSWAWTLLHLAFVALIIAFVVQIRAEMQNTLVTTRNFFGVLKVLDEDKARPQEHRRVLMHGRIEHGYQYLDADKRYWPTSYFGPHSGAGIAIRLHPKRLDPRQRHLRVGVVGLGAATLAAYGEAGDYFRFYEINPDVVRLSQDYFTYRRDCPAKVDVVLGDARISMEREKMRQQSGQFDVLIVDAFSSDAIPVHLLTRECYRIYQYHLSSSGILAIHISSRFFDLSPVIRSLAGLDSRHQVRPIRIEDDGSHMQGTDPTSWVLLTSNRAFLHTPEVQAARTPWKAEDTAPFLFTDDYSNLFQLLKKWTAD